LGSRYQELRSINEEEGLELSSAAQHSLGGLERLVIIQRINSRLQMLRRFLGEACPMASLRHPHLLSVFDIQGKQEQLLLIRMSPTWGLLTAGL